MKMLDWIASIGFILGVVALPFLLANWSVFLVRKARAEASVRQDVPMPIWSVLFFVVPLLVTLTAGALSKHIGHDQVIDGLKSFERDFHVSINGKPAKNPEQLLSTLKSLHWIFPHHSSPSHPIDVHVSDSSRSIRLLLSRDSGDPREYWVFYPRYWITSHNEIGRIRTCLFDAY